MNKKHAGGRPPKYKTKKELAKKIEKYFESCFKPIVKIVDGKCIIVKDSEGNAVKEQYRPFTVTGLADALDMSRETLLRYSEKDEFSDTIMRAKRKCELYAEERLFDKDGANGAKFSLANNFDGWKDKKENINVETNYEEYLKKVERR